MKEAVPQVLSLTVGSSNSVWGGESRWQLVEPELVKPI